MGKIKLRFSQKLFITEVSLILVFVVFNIVLQYYRENDYKTEFLDSKLQEYNLQVEDKIAADGIVSDSVMADFLAMHEKEGLRLTVIDAGGTVLYDNAADADEMESHADRKEIAEARISGKGHDIRVSETTGRKYFYSTTYFGDKGYFIRTSVPYSIELFHDAHDNSEYLFVVLIVMLILASVYYYFVRKIQINIDKLKAFAKKIENDENIENLSFTFPNNELGEISEHIVYLYSQLRRSEADKARLKRQLTQNIAHELKTPVNSIQGFLETIVHNPEMPEDTKKQFIERCYAQSKRLSTLLLDISSLIKIDEAPGSFDIERINLYGIISEVVQDVYQQLDKKNVKMLVLVRKDIEIRGNYSLVYSIFRNLSDNAIVYAGENVTITIKLLGEKDGFYQISFADNGVGVPKEHLEHLFERFYRVDKGRSRKLGGTGLGLAIVKNAVIMHGGTISARIANTGGLEFLFALPKWDGAEADS